MGAREYAFSMHLLNDKAKRKSGVEQSVPPWARLHLLHHCHFHSQLPSTHPQLLSLNASTLRVFSYANLQRELQRQTYLFFSSPRPINEEPLALFWPNDQVFPPKLLVYSTPLFSQVLLDDFLAVWSWRTDKSSNRQLRYSFFCIPQRCIKKKFISRPVRFRYHYFFMFYAVAQSNSPLPENRPSFLMQNTSNGVYTTFFGFSPPKSVALTRFWSFLGW